MASRTVGFPSVAESWSVSNSLRVSSLTFLLRASVMPAPYEPGYRGVASFGQLFGRPRPYPPGSCCRPLYHWKALFYGK